MALGTYQAPANTGKASSFKPQENVGKPIIAVPREFIEGFVTPQYKDPKDVVVYDVVDLSPMLAGQPAVILPSVITGSGAIRDRLKNYLPGGQFNDTDSVIPVPVKIVPVNREGKNTYYTIEGLEGQEHALAVAWDNAFGLPAIDAARTQAQAEALAAQQSTNGTSQPAWMNQGAGNIAPLGGTTPAAPVVTPPSTMSALDAAIAALTKS